MSKIIVLLTFVLISQNGISQSTKSKELLELTNTLNEKYAKDFDFSALIQMYDSIIYFENFGTTTENIPINKETLFNIASITKSITAVGIMKLVEKNKLKLTDSLDKFFNNVPKSKKSISIKMLLSHKSGFRQSYPLGNIVDSNNALETILKQKLAFTPGSSFQYSNQNFQLLALILEKVTQTKFEDYIKKNILLPLKMHNTFFWDQVNKDQNIAPLPKQISRRIGKRNWGFIGSGGIFTTTSDLLKFWNGIYYNGFLYNAHFDLLFETQYESKSGTQIGLGFFKTPETKWNTPELWTRGTESWGHNSVIRFLPQHSLTIIVSTNSGEIDNDPGKTGNRLISDLITDFLLKGVQKSKRN